MERLKGLKSEKPLTVQPIADGGGGGDEYAHGTANVDGIRDVAADLFIESQQYSNEELESESRAVQRKLDWIIMPVVRFVGPISPSSAC